MRADWPWPDASADQVDLLLEFLEAPEDTRQHLTRQLQAAATRSAIHICCLRPLGLYVVLPWSLALWLYRTLLLPAEEFGFVCAQLHAWLSGQTNNVLRIQ